MSYIEEPDEDLDLSEMPDLDEFEADTEEDDFEDEGADDASD